MKKLSVLFLTVLIASSAVAQGGDTLKSVVPYSVFPIGAIRYPGDSTLIKMFGMNFNWLEWAIDSTNVLKLPQQISIIDTSIATGDPFYKDTTSTKTGSSQRDFFTTAAYGKDIRVFMPGTSGVTGEYNYVWNSKSGFFISPSDPEWEIRGDTAAAGYVLSDLTGHPDQFIPSAASDPYYTSSDSTHIGTFSYEFVYFFDTTHGTFNGGKWEAAGDTDSLYSIEYFVKKDGDSIFRFYLADTITKKTYRSSQIANTQVLGRNVASENLANWKPLPTSIQYKIQKHILHMDTMAYHQDSHNIWTGPQVDVRVKNFKKIPIFVRCLRIRDWVAQRLLTGKADDTLKKIINIAKPHRNNSAIKAWTVGNEPYYQFFHCFAYLHDLFVKNGAPPLSVLAPSQNDLFIRVERDQSQYPDSTKMFLWHEWVPYFGMGYAHNVGTKYDWDYAAYPKRPFLPSTFSSSAADSAEWEQRSIFFESNYTAFTNQWQNVDIGYPSEANGGGAGYMNDLQNIARACYEVDPLHPIPYWGCYSAMASPIHGVPLWAVDSARGMVNDSIRHYRHTLNLSDSVAEAASISTSWADSLYENKYVNPYFTRNHLTKDSTIIADSLYHVFWDWRASTEAEIRSQLWTGICFGLKGYSANAAFDDIGNNEGFLWDADTGIVKSYNRTDLRLDGFLFTASPYYVGGKLSRPYDTGFFRHDTAYKIKTKLLPAFKGMYNAVKDAVVNELGPIARTLALLNWKGSVSWHKRDSTPIYLSRLPVKNVTEKNLAGTADPDSAAYIQFGIFKNPNDTVAIYISALNRRLWTDPNDTLTTDNRVILFQVDSTKFNSSYSATPLWRISDVSGKLKDTIITAHDNYSFTVKPGQGKLFRIAPALGLTTGEMSTNVYNNARHIAPIEYNKDSVLGYVATYEKNGQIFVAYPTETPTGLSKRIAGTPGDTLIDSSYQWALRTPAVAFDSASGRVGVVYCGIREGVHDDTASIFFKSATYPGAKYHFNPATNISGVFIVPKGYTPAPSIMPREDTSNGKDFWIGWTDTTHGGNIALEFYSGGMPLVTHFNFDLPYHAGFVSLASNRNFKNSVQIAYQESDLWLPDMGWLRHVFYLSATYNSGTNSITATVPLNISAPFGNCMNYHPQISLTRNGIVDVTWELNQISYNADRQTEFLSHSIVFRTRNVSGVWGKTLTAFSFDQNDPQPVMGTDPIVLYPNILHSDNADGSFTSWSTIYRLMWNDAKTNSAAMAISGRSDSSGGFVMTRGWEQYTMAEPSLEPSLPHLSLGDRIVQPLLYRSPVLRGDENFEARITQYDFPKTALVLAAITQKTLKIPPPIKLPPGEYELPVNCKPPFSGSLTVPYIHHDTTTTIMAFQQDANSGIDSTITDSVSWDDTLHVKTEPFSIVPGDTIEYGRYFRTGYNYGDTAAAALNLTDSNDFLKIRILLRRNISNTILAVLDSAVLKLSGLTQSADTSNKGNASYVVPGGLSDLVYISMEASRGDSTNGYGITQMEYYNDTNVIDIPPSSDSVLSYKKSDPTPTSQQSITTGLLEVTVIPNPFHTSATVSVDAPKDIPLNVTIFDELGHKVTELANGTALQSHSVFIISSQTLSTGFYFLRVQSGSEVVTRKVELIK